MPRLSGLRLLIPVNWTASIGGLQRHVSTLFIHPYSLQLCLRTRVPKVTCCTSKKVSSCCSCCSHVFLGVNIVLPWWITVVSEFPPVILQTLLQFPLSRKNGPSPRRAATANLVCGDTDIPYFLIDNTHLMYNAHPKPFRHSFWCIDNAHDGN
jgi:hypothetical protein